MSTDAWITLGVLAVTLAGLAWDRFPPAGIVLGATVSLLLLDVIDANQAFAGFANAAPLTVAALYVVAAAAQRTGLLSALVARLLGDRVDRSSQARLLLPVAGASSVFNNTPLVAMLIPDVLTWTRKHGVSASRYLLPLSFATILGGAVTVLGTSTNLVVSGLLENQGGDPFGIFELAKIGLPVAAVGLVVLFLASIPLVPQRVTASDRIDNEIREFAVEMEVIDAGPVDGLTVEAAGLRHLTGVYLFQIARLGQVIAPVAPDEVLRGGDRLTFVGRVDDVLDLQRLRGLRSAEEKHLSSLNGPRHVLYEVVVGRMSPVAGRTLQEADFRARYEAAVIAIHRAGQRVDAKLGQIRLRHGDTLVVLAGPEFRRRWSESRDFLLVSELDGQIPTGTRKAPLVAVALLGFITLSATGVLSTLEGALVAAGFLIATRVLTFTEAKRSLDLDVLLLIGAAFGLGAAVESSGLAADIAGAFTSAFDGFGTFGLVLGVVLATTVLTEIVTNNAAAVIVFPIALSIAVPAGIDPRLMAAAIAISASGSFLSPIGYQTNTMVYGPGGYRFTDYLRAGLPLSIAVQLTICAMVTVLN